VGLVQALIVVDVQRDFCSGGALAVPDAEEVIEPINALAEVHELVIATRDWHPPEHSSFVTQGGPWPVHCVRDTPGAQLHPALGAQRFTRILDKGQQLDLPGYSAFEETGLERWLREREVKHVHVAGLALDYCVRATSLDARAAGFDVVLHSEATRAVVGEDGGRVLDELRAAGVQIV
jgi:nicotinamidase/pyrazinamidase